METPSKRVLWPNAFKFLERRFKVGKDPYSIYATLNQRVGSMPAAKSI